MSDRSSGYATGRARRERILDAAITAYGRVGFGNATLTDIAAACDITRPGLLHHFPSREHLLTAVLERRDAVDRQLFRDAVQGERDPLDAVLAIVRSNLASPGLTALYTVLSAEATNPSHPAHEYFSALYGRLREELAEALRASGRLPPGSDAETLAAALLALKDGLALQALLVPGGVDTADVFRRTAAALASGAI